MASSPSFIYTDSSQQAWLTMVGPMAPRFFCSRCDAQFSDKNEYQEHVRDHPDTQPPAPVCVVCTSLFEDSLALEEHYMVTGHGAPFAFCGECLISFPSMSMFNEHRKWPSPCHEAQRKSPKSTDRFRETSANPPSRSAVGNTLSPTNPLHCKTCNRLFVNLASLNHHYLGCSAKSGTTPSASLLAEATLKPPRKKKKKKAKKSEQDPVGLADPWSDKQSTSPAEVRPELAGLHARPANHPPRDYSLASPAGPLMNNQPTASPGNAINAPSSPANKFHCNAGCGKLFTSRAGCEMHEKVVHGGGSGGFNHPTPSPPLAGRGQPPLSPRDAHIPRVKMPLPQPAPMRRPLPMSAPTFVPHSSPGPTLQAPAHASQPPTAAQPSIPGLAEVEQVHELTEKISPLMIPVDMYFDQSGSFKCGGHSWVRITIEKQVGFLEMLNGLVHIRLPPDQQAQHFLPPAKAFQDSCEIDYPVGDFESAPVSNSSALKAISITCSKILLQDGRYEVVKVAAVDVITCQILLNHLVCSDLKAPVKDWLTPKTGLSNFHDFEYARGQGYRVLRGWKAARTVLHKYMDRNTIVVGQDLRRDLDALRMIHGRSIDIAKVFEKAAKGPLSRQQLGIQSMSRTLLGIDIPTSAKFGHDVLQLAFAVRGMVMWALKNTEALGKKAKGASLDYQRSISRT
ncbi:unnamed protein product [Periconia digitata]|uniref:C2H2-type domain-containing protein n=1 Tax=Periconia digitata TaxID=1303443 RepID=A0A9W4XPH7_9PLEO|nr:unnamed protein product [Periconia digitata]